MAAPIKPLQQERKPPGPSPLTPEQRYWRSFKSQQLLPSPHSNPITFISQPLLDSTISSTSSTSAPPSIAVTSGTRITLHSHRTLKTLKSISRTSLTDVARSGVLRPDARVLACGGDSGAIQIFDTQSRAILKTWKEHKQPVWSVQWSPNDLTELMSCGDDGSVRIWRLGEDKETTRFNGHADYVRCGSYLGRQSASVVLSGSYDGTVRLWDARVPSEGETTRAAMTFKHTSPVESISALPSGTTILSAAGNQVSVLDLVAAKPMTTIRSHQKTITTLAQASNRSRVLAGGLDGHVKVIDTQSWTVVAGRKYGAPVLSACVVNAPSSSGESEREDRHLAVGLQSGVLSIRTRLSGQQRVQQREREKEMAALVAGTIDQHDAQKKRKTEKKRRTQSNRAKMRGIDHDGHDADIIVEGNERRNQKKLSTWEKALRDNYFSKSLDLVLASTSQNSDRGSKKKRQDKALSKKDSSIPSTSKNVGDLRTVLTLLTALYHRSALRTALAHRTASELIPILRFLVRYVGHPRHAQLLCRVAMLVLEMYAGDLGQSADVDELVKRLHSRVRQSVEVGMGAVGVGGMVGGVLAGNAGAKKTLLTAG